MASTTQLTIANSAPNIVGGTSISIPKNGMLDAIYNSWNKNILAQNGGNPAIQNSIATTNTNFLNFVANKSVSVTINPLTGGIGGGGIAAPLSTTPTGPLLSPDDLNNVSTANDIGLPVPSAGYSATSAKQNPTAVLTSPQGSGFPNYGLNAPSQDSYNAITLDQAQGDPNNSNAGFIPADGDLIAFYFYDIVNGQFIPFRATLTGISMPTSTNWTPVRYIGRADRLFIYEGFDKTLSFSFKVYATSPEEMMPMWQRINYLVSLASPADYTSGDAGSQFIVPPFIKLTIGDLFKNLPICMTSCVPTVPEESSWELTSDSTNYSFGDITRNATVGQLPMYIEVSITANVLEKKQPRAGVLQFSDTGTNVGGAIGS